MTVDMVNNPPHYTAGKYETIDIIEDTTWGYHLATAFKYLHRAAYKGKEKEDLRKAVWFLLRYIDTLPDEEAMINEGGPVEPVIEGDKFIMSKCVRCCRSRPVLNKDWVCAECLFPDGIPLDTTDRHDSPPTKTSIGYEDNPYMTGDSIIVSKGLVRPPEVSLDTSNGIPHPYAGEGLGGHTERQEYSKKFYGTHKPNTDQLALQELSEYD